MKIESIRINGFKCFGTEQTIDFNAMTCFIGANGCGKTTELEALCKMFGETVEQRTIKKSDFYNDPTKNDDIKEKELYIDVKFSFPDLVGDDNDPEKDEIPLTFRYMSISKANQKCFCRIRLEATWIDDNTSEGIIDSHLYWIKSDELIPKEEDKEKVRSEERSYIRIFESISQIKVY